MKVFGRSVLAFEAGHFRLAAIICGFAGLNNLGGIDDSESRLH
jgi:hypothetical protein